MEWTDGVGSVYRERGLGGRTVWGQRPAVIVVDLIYGFTDPSFPAGSNLDGVVAATRELLDAARAAGVPVVHTTIAFSPAHLQASRWLQKMPAMRGLVEGSHWVEVDERLGARADEAVVVKRAASAFGGTDLASLLTSLGVDTVVVCGATTSGCVRATAVDACMAGWSVFVPESCVGDRAREPHIANLFDIDAKYGDVISLRKAIDLLAGSGGNA
ncbi:TPA: isochorismatase family protein [Burkholderia vietnamiensis]|nr:isochorismatase family protein [Burkholderia multivorans]HDR8923030.1 isochorismatase family protein [Burkholderia vietnamiensis]HDR8980652.1 isochorismatase family protein [Burkholderia vietnamiensis]